MRRTDEDLRSLRGSVASMAEAAASGADYERFDYAFHVAMAESLHNSVLRRMYPVVFEAIAQGYRRTAHVHGSVEVALDYHRRILAAIENGDPHAASETTRAHILQALKDIDQNKEGDEQQ